MTKSTNKIIRETAEKHGVYMYEVAKLEGVSYDTFMRRMREEMPISRQNDIAKKIKAFAKQRKEG